MIKKVTVIGSGISGLSISRLLADAYEVEIVERAAKAGGLIKCDRIDGNLFHRVGGHVFNSKNAAVLDWFWQHFNRDEEFLKATRNAKILFDGQLIGYPLENYLYQLPEAKIREVISELLTMLSQKKDDEHSYDNFKDFLIGNFGTTLYELYFGPYNSKIWNTDISKVPLAWLDGKLPMPQIKEVIISNILKKEEGSMVHATFFLSKKGGSQFIIDRLAQGIKMELSTPISKIAIEGSKQLALNNGAFVTDLLVYCGDVRELANIITIPDPELREALDAVKDFASNGTSNVLCETDVNDISWLYLPEEKYKAHRIIYTGNFSDTNNEGTSRKTCVVEFSGLQQEGYMIAELKNLPGNLTPLAFNFEPNSYIIQDKQTRFKVHNLKRELSKYNIYLLGRFAEWEYYNMDKCIEAAMELSYHLHQHHIINDEKIISGTRALAHNHRDVVNEAGKYFLVGGVCTLMDFALLFILTHYFKVHFLTSSVISFMSGTLLNYYLCTFWIFKVRSVSNRNLEMVYYIIITGVGLGINSTLIWVFTTFLGYYFMVSKLLATFVTYWWNFGARKYFLHTKTTLQPEAAARIK